MTKQLPQTMLYSFILFLATPGNAQCLLLGLIHACAMDQTEICQSTFAPMLSFQPLRFNEHIGINIAELIWGMIGDFGITS